MYPSPKGCTTTSTPSIVADIPVMATQTENLFDTFTRIREHRYRLERLLSRLITQCNTNDPSDKEEEAIPGAIVDRLSNISRRITTEVDKINEILHALEALA